MHEVLLTRRDVMGLSEINRHKIFVAENCVLLHRVCHEEAVHKKEMGACIRSLIRWEGYDAIKAWLREMRAILPPDIVNQADYKLEVVWQEL